MNSGKSAQANVVGGAAGRPSVVVSGLFPDLQDAQAAVRELRDVGVAPGSISLISRDEDRTGEPELSGLAGVDREEVQDEGLTYRVSDELPNDEDLPTTEAAMTDQPVFTDWEVPPDEPLGGSVQLGLTRDADKVRRNEAGANADEDIYSDFTDKPGGFNPDSPAAARAGNGVQEDMRKRTGAGGTAAAGLGLGSLAGLLAGMAGLAIPGIGPFIAAGPLAGALSGLVAGGAAGGIIGALSTIGVPEEYAREYASRIQEGQTLISVRTDELSRDLVERVLTANRGEQVQCSVS